jgi:hypothetical protein
MREIFQRKSNAWVVYMYGCLYCERTFKTEKYCAKHQDECKTINTTKKLKSEDNMLIQRITKGGETYFRRGNQGRMYKTLEEAESSGKKEGADGKPCWEGYRFAGTKNGTDKCIKVRGN